MGEDSCLGLPDPEKVWVRERVRPCGLEPLSQGPLLGEAQLCVSVRSWWLHRFQGRPSLACNGRYSLPSDLASLGLLEAGGLTKEIPQQAQAARLGKARIRTQAS